MLALALLKYFKSTNFHRSVAPSAPMCKFTVHFATLHHFFSNPFFHTHNAPSRVIAHPLSHLSFVPQSSHDSLPLRSHTLSFISITPN
mmetsp:Transcript_28891/g.43091  ORF Transcript_28891/g.43091 Transcript_28891/m.43091 type:complete len:88 (-) Transcript_28891:946-1209(-)